MEITKFSGKQRKLISFLASFFGLELAIRVMGMASALVVVRYMPKEEYAFYALANNFQESLTVFSAMGIGAALLAVGGEAIGDRRRMGEVAAAAMRQRLSLLWVGTPVAIGIFGYLLWKNGCPAWQISLLLLTALLMLSQAIAVQIAHFSFGLARQYRIPQMAEAGTAALRFLSIGLLLAGGWLFPVPLQIVSLFSGAVMLWLFSMPRARAHVEFGLTPPAELQQRFRRIMWHSMPGTFNGIFQGQIAMWLIALSGSSGSVADFGALTRLGLLLTIPSAFVGKVITPRLAAEQDLSRLFKLWIGVVSLGFGGGAIFFLTVVFFRHNLVGLLGQQYANVSEYMMLYAGYIAYQFAIMSAFSILQAKGWLKNYWVVPVSVFIFQLISLSFLHVDNVQGAILFRWIGDLGGTIVLAGLTLAGFKGKSRL